MLSAGLALVRIVKNYDLGFENVQDLPQKVLETSSVLHRKSSVIFRNLRQSSEIFGKCLETSVWLSDNF